jgi:cell division inhibitor SulA/protein ImuA
MQERIHPRLRNQGHMPREHAIDRLLVSTPQIWKGRQASRGQRALTTGHARLDARLPGKGWPLGAMTELISRKPGLGEFRLLFPALAETGARGQWVILVDPPWIPYPAALHGHGLLLERLLLVRTRGGKESLWACEQALQNGRGGAVLAWPERIGFARLRRLQIAAGNSAKLAFLFRPESAFRDASPAALRLRLEPGERHGTLINILKCRGSRPPEPVWIPQPFSAYAKRRCHTQEHALLAENSINAELAGSALSTTGAGPAHPRSKQH